MADSRQVIVIDDSSSDSELEFSQVAPPRQLTRLKRRNEVAQVEIEDDDASSVEILDLQFNIDYSEDELHQLNNATWLMAVVNHLLPKSNPIPDTESYLQKFFFLKKQWGYTRQYYLVDADKTDCTLCTHPHVAMLFAIQNILNENVTYAASHCITQFQVRNDNSLFNRKISKDIILEDIEKARNEIIQTRKQTKSFFRN